VQVHIGQSGFKGCLVIEMSHQLPHEQPGNHGFLFDEYENVFSKRPFSGKRTTENDAGVKKAKGLIGK
jgi:hypothetical protein